MSDFFPSSTMAQYQTNTTISTKIPPPECLSFSRSTSPYRATVLDIMVPKQFRTSILEGLLATIISTDLIVAIEATHPSHGKTASFPECLNQTTISCCTKTEEGACWRTACGLPKHLIAVAGGLVPTITECWMPLAEQGSTGRPPAISPSPASAPTTSQTAELTSPDTSTPMNRSATSPAGSPGSAAMAMDTALPSSMSNSTAASGDVTAAINYTKPAEPSKSDLDHADQQHNTVQSGSATMQSWTTTFTVKYNSSYLTTATTKVANFDVEEVFTYLSVESTDPGAGRIIVDDKTMDRTSSAHSGGHMRVASPTRMISSQGSPYAAPTRSITRPTMDLPSTSQTRGDIEQGASWTNSTTHVVESATTPTRRVDQAKLPLPATFAAGHGRLPIRTATTTIKSTITVTVTSSQPSDTAPANAIAMPPRDPAKPTGSQSSYQPTATAHDTNGAMSTSTTSSIIATDPLSALRERTKFCKNQTGHVSSLNNSLASTSSGTTSMPTTSQDPRHSSSASAVSMARMKRSSNSERLSYESSRLQGGACTTCGSDLLWTVVGVIAMCGAVGAILAAI